MMTSRERVITAMRNGIPDRVPVAPDISTYMQMKHSGLTDRDFWTECKGNIPQWQADLDTADYFGMDAWTAVEFGLPTINEPAQVEWKIESVLDKALDVMVQTTTVKTPDGELKQVNVCFRGGQAAPSERLIKNLTKDFRKFKHTQLMPKALDLKMLQTFRSACRKRNYAFGVTVTYPGFHMWNSYVHGGIETLSYAEMDTPEILQEWFEWDLERGTQVMELPLQVNLDYIMFGGSGTITMASPELAARYAIPALKEWSKMAKDSGLPTMLYSCGKRTGVIMQTTLQGIA